MINFNAGPAVADRYGSHQFLSSLRILMINYEFPPLGGGTGMACAALLEEFRRRQNLHVELITSSSNRQVQCLPHSDRINIHYLPTPKQNQHYWRMSELLGWTMQALRYASMLTHAQRFDLCHCWGGWPSGIVGRWLVHRQPYIVSLRGSDVPGYNKRLRMLDPLVMRHLCRRIWSHAARVVAVSRNLRSLALQTQPTADIDVIPNGVDVNRFRPSTSSACGLLFVGRLIERKNTHILIEACSRLVEIYPDLTLTIAGDGPERPRLEELVRRHRLGDRVRFLGHLKHDALATAYKEASILVLPAATDAMPNVVLEAMAAGLAIVTTQNGAAEVVRGNGLLLDRADPGIIYEVLCRYLNDAALLMEHQQASRFLAEQMSWATVAEYFLAIYDEVLAAPERVVVGPGREFRLPVA